MVQELAWRLEHQVGVCPCLHSGMHLGCTRCHQHTMNTATSTMRIKQCTPCVLHEAVVAMQAKAVQGTPG
jgi:hypothetical protein